MCLENFKTLSKANRLFEMSIRSEQALDFVDVYIDSYQYLLIKKNVIAPVEKNRITFPALLAFELGE